MKPVTLRGNFVAFRTIIEGGAPGGVILRSREVVSIQYDNEDDKWIVEDRNGTVHTLAENAAAAGVISAITGAPIDVIRRQTIEMFHAEIER